MRFNNGACLKLLVATTLSALAAGCVADERERPADALSDSAVDAAGGGDAGPGRDGVAPDMRPADATSPTPDGAVPPLDEGVRDADPRALADLWSPDFGPPPDDMPEEIRWMHGRMWCDAPRPPRVMPDGSSECDHVEVQTPPGPYFADRPDYIVNNCRAWPSRTAEVGLGGPEGVDAYLGCNADFSVCCTFYTYEEYAPRPCGWSFDAYAGERETVLPPSMESARPWLEANGLRALVAIFTPNTGMPPEMEGAWQSALNNCHPVCKRPACGP